MRTIVLGGLPCLIKATAGTIAGSTSRLSEALAEADFEAEEQAKQRDMEVDEYEQLCQRLRKKAQLAYLNNAENSLRVISDMVNAAVDSERILYGRDIRDQSPYYPMTPEKLAIIASTQELNDPDMAQSIAEEIAEATGSKNLSAGELVKIAQMIL